MMPEYKGHSKVRAKENKAWEKPEREWVGEAKKDRRRGVTEKQDWAPRKNIRWLRAKGKTSTRRGVSECVGDGGRGEGAEKE